MTIGIGGHHDGSVPQSFLRDLEREFEPAINLAVDAPTGKGKMNVTRVVPSTERVWLFCPPFAQAQLQARSVGGVPTTASSASRRLAATGPLTDGGGRFAI